MTAPTIAASVGKNGKNRADDVKVIQSLLNEPAVRQGKAPIPVNGTIGSHGDQDPTVQAILAYQSLFLAKPDGRVDVSSSPQSTLQRLRTGWSFIVLPKELGKGYYSYSPSDRQYGTPATIQALCEVARTVHFNDPTHPIGIGDISFANGGKMSPHASHRRGRHVDIRPMRKDGRTEPISIDNKEQYDHRRTCLLVDSLLAHKNVSAILFNDIDIRGVRWWKGHNNHLHVTMKE
ncbi:MAG: penicillin-insensitive murein endopeptidase [Planctomycetota bacterium]